VADSWSAEADLATLERIVEWIDFE